MGMKCERSVVLLNGCTNVTPVYDAFSSFFVAMPSWTYPAPPVCHQLPSAGSKGPDGQPVALMQPQVHWPLKDGHFGDPLYPQVKQQQPVVSAFQGPSASNFSWTIQGRSVDIDLAFKRQVL
ncbi:hypothetical protein M514_10247 [Trichuris suis]|uniref:Uncharacterized protein n=1 Tax=Trichuris suis TaxID=68888 RepID=A0A085N9R1_9BILA|nr:hypothetical protein M513_10247 [Trichuris suis]KFD66207.1 hypothetical protein M514_10247 [Trichuris suis]